MRMREQQINPHLFPLAPIDCSNHIMKQQRGSVFPLFNTKVACFATTHGRHARPKFTMNHRIAKFFTCECEAHEDAKLGPAAATHSAGHNAKFEVSLDCRSVCPTDSQPSRNVCERNCVVAQPLWCESRWNNRRTQRSTVAAICTLKSGELSHVL